jgi:hypothetical protein
MRRARIPAPSFIQDGENPLGDGKPLLRGGTGMFMRWPQFAETTADGIAMTIEADMRREEFALPGAGTATGAATPASNSRNNPSRAPTRAHALDHGGAID